MQEGSSIDLLHARFRDHTTALFKKHGMTIIGYWQPVAKPNTLVYLLAYKDGTAIIKSQVSSLKFEAL